MSDRFFVKTNGGQLVAAKFLSYNGSYFIDPNAAKAIGTKIYDANGNLIVNANPSGYLIVPENYTIDGTLAFATQVGARFSNTGTVGSTIIGKQAALTGGGLLNLFHRAINSSIDVSGADFITAVNANSINAGARFADQLLSPQSGTAGSTDAFVSGLLDSAGSDSTCTSIPQNIDAGRAPDGSPLGVALPNGQNGQMIWVKDQGTDGFMQVLSQSDDAGKAYQFQVTYTSAGQPISTRSFVSDGATATETTATARGSDAPIVTASVRQRDPDVATSTANYVVQPGDTLWGLAQRDGVSLQNYLDANKKITDPDNIPVGQVIDRPPSAMVAPTSYYDALRVADPSSHDAAEIVRSLALRGLDAERHSQFAAYVSDMLGDRVKRQKICDVVRTFGRRTYFPHYMIDHRHQKGLSGAKETYVPNRGLVANFNSNAAWRAALTPSKTEATA